MNYINKDSIYGLMNKYCEYDTSQSFWKNRKHSKKVVCCDYEEYDNFCDEINYMYLNNPTGIKGEYSVNQIRSIIDESFLGNNLTRQNHREIFETVRKYYTKIRVRTSFEDFNKYYEKLIEMIEIWRYELGYKYRWQEHAGIDKAFFIRCLDENFFNNYLVYLFFIEDEDVLVGYSVMPKKYSLNENGLNEASYIIRKTRNIVYDKKLRNITEYIDWYTFQDYLLKNKLNNIIINWGCSSGGVEWYKEHKWPLYDKEKKWFLKKKNIQK